MDKSPRLVRYSEKTRMVHWGVAILFFAAALSGLAFFHPSLFFLSNLFGGGSWTRILHPYIGIAMVALFALIFVQLWRHNRMEPADREWLKSSGAMLRGEKAGMPPVGRYNGGQKLLFWVMAVCLALLLITGILFWQPWFGGVFPILLVRIAVVIHALSAVILVVGVIVHIYAAIWVKGTTEAMTRGTVSSAWAKQNHPLWHGEMTDKR